MSRKNIGLSCARKNESLKLKSENVSDLLKNVIAKII